MQQQNTVPPRPDWLVPGYPELRGEVGQAAVNGQIVYYPKVVRSQEDECIESQTRGLVSFMLLKEPRQTKDGLVYGFFKLRGNWSSEEQATAKASKIVRDVDSKYPIRVAHVGHWLPITNDEGFVKRNVNVNVEEKEDDAKKVAMKEEEERQKRIMRELKEREEEIKNAADYNDDKEHINYYTMKMVTWLRLHETIEQHRKKLQDLEGKLVETRKILHDLDSKHPEYNEAWIDTYNIERRKGGIPDYIPGNAEIQRYVEGGKQFSSSPQ